MQASQMPCMPLPLTFTYGSEGVPASRLPILTKREEKRFCATEKRICQLQSSVHEQVEPMPPKNVLQFMWSLSTERFFQEVSHSYSIICNGTCVFPLNCRSDSRSWSIDAS